MKTINDYADLVKEQHALNTTIAPVETDLTSASQAYAVGQKFIYDGVRYQAKTAIAQGAALVLNTNYEAADDVSSEIEALTNELNDEIATRAMLSAHNLFGVGDFSEWFAAGSDGKLPLEYPASATITATTDKNTNSITVTNYDSTGYRWGCRKVNLKKNTRYVFSFASITGTMRFFGKNDADAQATLIANLPATVNTGNYDTYYVGFYPTVGGGYFTATNMLVKLETDADTTFQSYAKTNQELTAENQTLTNNLSDEVETRATLGAHNLCSFNESFTLVRGTDDTNRLKDISINSVPILDSYVVSFKVSNASNATKINLQIGKRNSSMTAAAAVTDLSEGRKSITFTFSEEVDRLYFYLTSSDPSDATITISEIMITSPSDPSIEYTPYAMTNRELTENATYKKGDTIAISSNPLYLSAFFQSSKQLRFTIPINKPISASGATVTINLLQVFNNGNYDEISSGLTATAYKVDGIGLYVVLENAVDFTTFTAYANAAIRCNASIAFT